MSLESAASIRLLVLDVDGVLTDGRLWFGPEGEVLKVFHVRDGAGIKALQAAGVTVALISGRRSAALERRALELGIRHLRQGADNKAAAFRELAAEVGVSPAVTACVVDDTPDLPLMALVALPIAVADAHPDVIAAARHVTRARGGHGAVREVCDLLIEARA
ncbi:MAG TPA: HAD hydrolase family protein [Steroidobacteraceae bacterium]|nr:HAD hydrolase family protein [Steroidobacteraceae bacterium]